MHGSDSREYKFYPKVLGLALDVLLEDETFDLNTYLQLMGDDRPHSETISDIDNLLLEQIRKDVRAGRWDSLKHCGNPGLAFLVILNFLGAFPKAGELKIMKTNNLSVEFPEQHDRRNKLRYLFGMICWCARLMNILIKPDTIEDAMQIDQCYRTTVQKLIPAELLVGKLDVDSPRNLNQSGDPAEQTIEYIKQA